MTAPSAWPHRVSVALLALVGCALAIYLTLFQWHLTGNVWDPVFGSRSSEVVLESAISRSLPIPDATIGAIVYAAECGLAVVGGTQRWWTMPWTVALFALVAAGLAAAAAALLLSQVLLVHAFCSLCLCSAGISFINLWLARGAAGASLAYLRRGRDEGRSLWDLFWGRAHSAPGPKTGRAA
jgi:uncharacterized membrane protein